MPPPGMELLAHVIPIDRRLFDPHVIKDFSVAVAMGHYRCFKIFILSTGRVRIDDNVIWFPRGRLKIPIPLKDELLAAPLMTCKLHFNSL